MTESIFKQDAKSIVDMLFDAGFFKKELTRDDFNSIENFIAFSMQSRHDSHIKITEIMKKIKQ